MNRITIDPVSRIEGHAKITIQLGDDGHVTDARLHVTQVRGFEKFTEGRPFYEMPSITARICGICPVSHLLASAKACDAIMAVTPPPAGLKLRELITRTYRLDEINRGYADLDAGRNLRGVVVFDD